MLKLIYNFLNIIFILSFQSFILSLIRCLKLFLMRKTNLPVFAMVFSEKINISLSHNSIYAWMKCPLWPVLIQILLSNGRLTIDYKFVVRLTEEVSYSFEVCTDVKRKICANVRKTFWASVMFSCANILDFLRKCRPKAKVRKYRRRARCCVFSEFQNNL